MDAAYIHSTLSATEGVELLPPATADEVAAFEAQHGITLPEPYRSFLLTVTGGVLLDGEPWLYSLSEITDQLVRDRSTAAKPFGYDAAATTAILTAVRAGKAGGNVFTPEVMALQKSGSPDGCLTLACNGGNDFSVLVVTGDQRGRMWRTGELDAPEVHDLYKPDPSDEVLDFEGWLPLWSECFLGTVWSV
jgi:hypothetical protein